MAVMIITDISELDGVAREVLGKLDERKVEGKATVLALHGNLGAGKTTFMQAFARMFSVVEPVTSPTFVIMKSYHLSDATYSTLCHIDAYRIEDVDEMRPLGFDALLSQKGTIIAIEWAENIAELLPEHTVHMYMEIEGAGRKITFQYGNK